MKEPLNRVFKEYDVIIAKESIGKIPKGSKGTILIVYDKGNNYEVEFVDSDGNTIDVVTVRGNMLESQ